MADAADEDLFADLYDGEDAEPEAARPVAEAPKAEPEVPVVKAELTNDVVVPKQEPQQDDDDAKPFDPAAEEMDGITNAPQHQSYDTSEMDRTPVHMKDDGKMFIGGLNWETTDQSLKDYFTQFGEVTECTVMRDGVTGRSRGFGFLTFKDPKVVNVVMVKEHLLDGKLIDPKRAIPRDEQEKTSKIFVGGVSQEATETDFRQFFAQFGNVLDCTLMMDKDTGRPRGFGFVTFDDDTAVERTLMQPLAIHGKPIEVKRAEPRGNLREEGGGGGGRGGRFGGAGRGGGVHQNNFGAQQDQAAQAGGANNMSPAMMAQYWQRMQQYFQMMQQQMQGGGMAGGMNPQMAAMQQNPQMMQQMMASMGRGQGGGGGGMNPQMMQQMAAMQGGGMQGGMQGGGAQQNAYPSGGSMSGSASPGPSQQQSGFNAQEQMVFEQQKYERQQMARMQGQNVNGGSTWEGMYDDVPAPAGVNNRGGGFAGRGGRGGGAPAGPGGPRGTPGNAPVGAPTGPKNAGMPGSNYRGGGRGGRGGGGGGGRFDPYARNAK